MSAGKPATRFHGFLFQKKPSAGAVPAGLCRGSVAALPAPFPISTPKKWRIQGMLMCRSRCAPLPAQKRGNKTPALVCPFHPAAHTVIRAIPGTVARRCTSSAGLAARPGAQREGAEKSLRRTARGQRAGLIEPRTTEYAGQQCPLPSQELPTGHKAQTGGRKGRKVCATHTF